MLVAGGAFCAALGSGLKLAGGSGSLSFSFPDRIVGATGNGKGRSTSGGGTTTTSMVQSLVRLLRFPNRRVQRSVGLAVSKPKRRNS